MGLLLYTLSAVLDFLFPRSCVICDTQGSYLCNSCQNSKFSLSDRNFCHVCYKFLDESPVNHQESLKVSSLDAVYAVVNYNKHAAAILFEIKYNFYFAVADDVAAMMLAKIAEIDLDYTTIIPVPLSRKRKWWRGFNQSELLAAKLGGKDFKSLLRSKYKHPQVGLGRKERQQNIKDAFIVTRSFAGEKVLLIDDVFTTGSTLEECARVLKAAGADKVYALVWARD